MTHDQSVKYVAQQVVQIKSRPKTLWKRCGDAVQLPITSCGGIYFKHAQRQRRGLAFAQHALVTLWGLLDRRGRVVGACANC